MNQANFLLGYEFITTIIVLDTAKEKSLGINFNQDNWMLVIRLMAQAFHVSTFFILETGHQNLRLG